MFIAAITIALVFIAIQVFYFIQTRRAIKTYRSFFQKEKWMENYDTYESGKTLQLINVAPVNSEFCRLIEEVNRYIYSTKGTTEFSILQIKVERKLSMLGDQASARLSFPTHIGLMGTFVGVLIGLAAFNYNFEDLTGITDAAIRDLLYGVLISMATSFIGLLLTTWNNNDISSAQKQIDDDKNEFYDFIQTELMPSLDENITKAISHLHHTVSDFAPTFNSVIDNFKSTFETCTQSFGNSFNESVKTVTTAVEVMASNMDKINENVELQEKILSTIKGQKLAQGMQKFIDAASSFERVTYALQYFENLHNEIVEATQQTIECQRQYNESLSTPTELINSINQLLERVKNYEESVNLVAEKLRQEDIITTAQFNAMEATLKAIKDKQRVVDNFSDEANEKVEAHFKQQVGEIETRSQEHRRTVNAIFDALEEQQHTFIAAHKQKIDLKDIDKEFAHLANLEKIDTILQLLTTLSDNAIKQNALNEMFKDLSSKLSKSRYPITTPPPIGSEPGQIVTPQPKWYERLTSWRTNKR